MALTFYPHSISVGDVDARVRAVLSTFGLKNVIWNVLTNDSAIPDGPAPSSMQPGGWFVSNATRLVQNVIASGPAAGGLSFLPNTGGYISLEHELTLRELELAANVISAVKNNGFNVVVCTYSFSDQFSFIIRSEYRPMRTRF